MLVWSATVALLFPLTIPWAKLAYKIWQGHKEIDEELAEQMWIRATLASFALFVVAVALVLGWSAPDRAHNAWMRDLYLAARPWIVGGGIEFAIAGHWTAKAEYLYVDLGHFSCGIACGATTQNVSFDANLFRGGINYRF